MATPEKLYRQTVTGLTEEELFRRTVVPCLMVSDIHMGAEVIADEVGGFNAYNCSIASRRLVSAFDHFLQQLALMRLEGRVFTDAVIIFGGDTVETFKSSMEPGVDSRGAARRLLAATLAQLKRLADEGITNVQVVCAPGNHGQKSDKFGGDDEGTNWDAEFYARLHERCDELFNQDVDVNGEVPCFNVDVVYETDKHTPVLLSIMDRLFVLTHGESFKPAGGGKEMALLPYAERVMVGAMNHRHAVLNRLKTLLEGKNQDELLELLSRDAIQLSGHFHCGFSAAAQGVMACPSLRGIDRYVYKNSFNSLELPGALSWAVTAPGQVVHEAIILVDEKVDMQSARDARERFNSKQRVKPYIVREAVSANPAVRKKA